MNLKRFNIRVYGILINDYQQVLVADEVFQNGTRATKFPGGGLELGEGTVECLIREFSEEAGIKVSVRQHFYTTDFFQPSFLDNDSQIISIYYLVESTEWKNVKVAQQHFDFTALPGEEKESFRWVDISSLAAEPAIHLPIDRIVVQLLSNKTAG